MQHAVPPAFVLALAIGRAVQIRGSTTGEPKRRMTARFTCSSSSVLPSGMERQRTMPSAVVTHWLGCCCVRDPGCSGGRGGAFGDGGGRLGGASGVGGTEGGEGGEGGDGMEREMVLQ